MLTRLEVDGFKSFENLAIDLSPFTAVVGNNAAGKSNLFDVIQLLSNLATRDVAEAVKDMRGEPLELFRLTPTGRVRCIKIAAEVLGTGTHCGALLALLRPMSACAFRATLGAWRRWKIPRPRLRQRFLRLAAAARVEGYRARRAILEPSASKSRWIACACWRHSGFSKKNSAPRCTA